MEPFRQAKYDLLWVIDATITVTPHVLGRMVDAFVSRRGSDVENSPLISDDERPPPTRGQVGLVHQVPIAVVYQRTWGSLIEQAYLNSTHAKMYLSIVSDDSPIFPPPCQANPTPYRTASLSSRASSASRTCTRAPMSSPSPPLPLLCANSLTHLVVSPVLARSWLKTT